MVLNRKKLFLGLPPKESFFSLSLKKLLKTRGDSGFLKSDDFFSHVLGLLSHLPVPVALIYSLILET